MPTANGTTVETSSLLHSYSKIQTKRFQRLVSTRRKNITPLKLSGLTFAEVCERCSTERFRSHRSNLQFHLVIQFHGWFGHAFIWPIQWSFVQSLIFQTCCYCLICNYESIMNSSYLTSDLAYYTQLTQKTHEVLTRYVLLTVDSYIDFGNQEIRLMFGESQPQLIVFIILTPCQACNHGALFAGSRNVRCLGNADFSAILKYKTFS